MADSTANRRVYNLICEHDGFALTVALDPSNKVGGLFIRPLNLPTTAQGVIDQWKANKSNAAVWLSGASRMTNRMSNIMVSPTRRNQYL
ncbi:MAG: hypothetical protein WDO15_25055 [Bacteroidota bacterium]